MKTALKAIELGMSVRAAAREEYVDYEFLDDDSHDAVESAVESAADAITGLADVEEHNLLALPPIPKRLNKRTVKRTANVISSDAHIENLQLGRSDKRQKLADKDQRAIEREGKRNQKKAADLVKARKNAEKAQLKLQKLQTSS